MIENLKRKVTHFYNYKFTIFIFTYLLFSIAVFAQDSSKQKHSLFKLSGVSMIGGSSFLNDIEGNNHANISKQELLSMWPDFANKPYSNYSQKINGAYGSGGMFGVYFNFDNYSKKKNKYSLHSQTNIGINVVNRNNLSTNFIEIKTARMDTLYSQSGSMLYPQYYRDSVTINGTFISYGSTNVGIDAQQIFSTNQKRILSFFAGIGGSVNFSVSSKVGEWSNKATGITISEYSNYNYSNSNLNLYHSKGTAFGLSSHEVKNSVFYNFYIPLGFNVRLGKNEKRIFSHIYLTTQFRFGYEILKIQSVNAFTFTTSYRTFGLKYRF